MTQYEALILNRIKYYTTNLIYWQKKAAAQLEQTQSPYYALSVAMEYAKDIEVEKARLRDSFDWEELYAEAVKQAEQKFKDDKDGL